VSQAHSMLRAAGRLVIAALVAAVGLPAQAAEREDGLKRKFDRSSVPSSWTAAPSPRAGNLQMNVTTSVSSDLCQEQLPDGRRASAQWPAGSGIEASTPPGSGSGAEADSRALRLDRLSRNGALSLHRSDRYHLPGERGADGGNTYPSNPDDDGDGRIKRGLLNGRDDGL